MSNQSTRYVVRNASADDWPTIVDFNRRLAMETEGLALDPDVLKSGVQAALADPAKARYFVACPSDQVDRVVGQVMHTWEWSDWRNGTIWWLQSVYVASEHRGHGVFRMLFEHLKQQAEADESVVGIRLYIEHQNKRARAAYQQLGMVPGGYDVMESFWVK
ncbi:MAG: GNAT family N-acetyltransferase [Planctomycetota bacterium]|nr:MAG: GNAT family N-acetyltransferase [Planctomycetota bacterium]REJ97028.1 MAG: GNAT family N-acetyltransferase [Planctomycetota bacterium]REK29651.1 MAG: GNAT family N-acetyltransferase [Planctomycetota bacterium]REK30528.1 MAG: GNAT family N-acetyltransferase [Planctomycetota bacterium]